MREGSVLVLALTLAPCAGCAQAVVAAVLASDDGGSSSSGATSSAPTPGPAPGPAPGPSTPLPEPESPAAGPTLVFLRSIGGPGSAPGQLNLESGVDETGGVFFAGDRLYVADWSNERLQRFSLEGQFLDALGQVEGVWSYRTSGAAEPLSSSASRVMSSPIFVDRVGNLYAGFRQRGLRKFSPSGALLEEIGIDFSNFRRFTLDPQGNIFAQSGADTNEIKKYDAAGQLLHTFGGFGAAPGQFDNSGVTVDLVCDSEGDLYALDRGGARLQKFDNEGRFLSQWSVQISGYANMAIDEQDQLYVAEDSNRELRVYSTRGERLRSYPLPSGALSGGGGELFVRSGFLFVSSLSRDDVRVYSFREDVAPGALPRAPQDFVAQGSFERVILDWADDSLASSWRVYRAEGAGEFEEVTSTLQVVGSRAVDASRTPGATYRYQVSGRNGGGAEGPRSNVASVTVPLVSEGSVSLRTTFAGPGSGNGQLRLEVGVDDAGSVFLAGGRIYVTDWRNQRLQRFSSQGAFQDWIGSVSGVFGAYTSGTRDEVRLYSALHVDASGNVYVTSISPDEGLRKFSPAGADLGLIPLSISNFGRFTLDSSGNVFAQSRDDRDVINKYSPSGALLASFGGFGAGEGQSNNQNTVAGVAANAQGEVFVLDVGGQRVQRFSNSGAFLGKWPLDGSTRRPHLALDLTQGEVYVVESGPRLNAYSSQGQLLASYSLSGIEGLGEFVVRDRTLVFTLSQSDDVHVYDLSP